MSRTKTAGERAAVGALRAWHYSKFEVQDADGVYRDYTQYLRTDWFTGASIQESIDQNTMTLNATLLRETGTLSLAPFRSDSLVNRNAGGSYATAIDAWRKWKLSVAVMREGYPPTGTDWKEMCQGRIDTIEWSGDQIIVTGRGEEAVLLDFWIATERQYGSVGGIAMETTVQSMWTNNLNAVAPTLYTPVSPGYLMNVWTQLKGHLFPASATVAQKAGAVIRYRHDSSDVYRPTLFIPNRGAIPGDEVWTLGAYEITGYQRVAIDKKGIRNFIKLRFAHATLGTQTVIYPHMAGTGTVSCAAGVATFSSSQAGIIKTSAADSNTEIIVAGIPYTVTAFNGTTSATLLSQLSTGGVPTFSASAFTLHDTLSGAGTTTSLTRFGRVDMELDLSFDTQVNDATKAQGMCDVIGSDMEFPDLEQQFETLGLWFVQLHDYGKFEANGIHYDEAQYGGVTSIRHDIADATIKSTIGVREKPSGAYKSWRFLGQSVAPDPTAQNVIPLICRAKVQTTTATQVVFRVAVADPFPLGDITLTYTGTGVGAISPASPQTILRANVTNNIDTTGTVDITVNRAAFGTGTGRITFTATSPGRTSSNDAGEVPSLDRDTQSLSVLILRISETASQLVVQVYVISPNAGATVTVAYNNGGLTVSPASGGTLTSTTLFSTTGSIQYTITRDAIGGTPRRVAFTASAPGFIDATDGVDVPPNSERFRCRAYHSVAQAIANITPTVLALDSELYDTGAIHDNATNNSRFTIPTGGDNGVWRFKAQVCWAINAAGDRRVAIIKNGSLTGVAWSSQLAAGGLTFQSASTDEDAPAVGDYFEVLVDQSSGGNLNVLQAPGQTFFTALHQF